MRRLHGRGRVPGNGRSGRFANGLRIPEKVSAIFMELVAEDDFTLPDRRSKRSCYGAATIESVRFLTSDK